MVGVCFGRWNPPHQGHKAAWETAAQFDHFYVGTNKNTEGPKDPLPYEVKLKCMEAIWPEIAGHVIPEQSLFTLVSKVYAKHGEHTHLKVCTDEDWLTKSLIQYNGQEGAHGYYKFASIQQVPTPRLSSATALRAAVRAGDKDAFAQAAGVDANTPIHIGKRSMGFFDVVAHYLAKHPEPVKRAKAVAETRMSAQVKLQRAWEREQAKSAASRKRGEEVMAQAKKDAEKDKKVSEMDGDSSGRDGSNRKRISSYGTRDRDISGPDIHLGPEHALTRKQMQDRAWKSLQKTLSEPENMAVLKRLKAKESLTKDEMHERFMDNLTSALLDEARNGKMHGHHLDASQGYFRIRDIGGYDRTYHLNRIMMAAAMADGKSKKPVDMDADSWVEKYNVMFPYSEEERLMMFQAMATVPTDGAELEKRGKSKEAKDTNITSPVAKPKRNKYGI